MLYHLHTLPRHRSTRQPSVGYVDRIDYADVGAQAPSDPRARRDWWPGAAEVGMVLTGWGPDPLPPAPVLVKTLEHHRDRFGREAFAERLCLATRGRLLPYRVRYRTATQQHTLVQPRAIGRIHALLDAFDPTAWEYQCVDPRVHFYTAALNYAGPDSRRSALFDDVFGELTDGDWADAGQLCPDHHAYEAVLAELSRVAEAVDLTIERHASLRSPANELLRATMTTPTPVLDPLLQLRPDGLELGFLERQLVRTAPVVVDVPPPLRVEDDGALHHAGPEYAWVAEHLAQLRCSDVCLEYAVRGGALVTARRLPDPQWLHQPLHHTWAAPLVRRVVFALDRYAAVHAVHAADWERDFTHCDAAILALWPQTDGFLFRLAEPPGTCNFDIRLTKTFNEEALITFSPVDSRRVVHAVYFDLALLSLCSLGVAAEAASSGR